MKLFTKPLFENAHFFNNKLYRFFSRAELFSVYGAATFWFYDIYLTYSEQSLGLGTSGYMYAAVACALGTAFFSKEQEKIYHHQLSTTEKIFPFLHSKIVHDEYNENVRRLVDLILSGNLSPTEEAEAKRRYEALISSKIREAFHEEKHPEVLEALEGAQPLTHHISGFDNLSEELTIPSKAVSTHTRHTMWERLWTQGVGAKAGLQEIFQCQSNKTSLKSQQSTSSNSPEVDIESLNNKKMEKLPLPNNATLPTRSHSHKYFYHK